MKETLPSSQIAVSEVNIRDEFLCSLEERAPVLQHRQVIHDDKSNHTLADLQLQHREQLDLM